MINELGKKCNLRVIRVLHLFILRNRDKTKNLSEVVHKLLFDILVFVGNRFFGNFGSKGNFWDNLVRFYNL